MPSIFASFGYLASGKCFLISSERCLLLDRIVFFSIDLLIGMRREILNELQCRVYFRRVSEKKYGIISILL